MATQAKTGGSVSTAPTQIATEYDVTESPVPEVRLPAPRMGQVIRVVAGADRFVINREFGGRYSETEASPATVNLRILRLLQDGDLIRQPDE